MIPVMCKCQLGNPRIQDFPYNDSTMRMLLFHLKRRSRMETFQKSSHFISRTYQYIYIYIFYIYIIYIYISMICQIGNVSNSNEYSFGEDLIRSFTLLRSRTIDVTMVPWKSPEVRETPLDRR